MTNNALTVNAPEGLPFIDFQREFDAPPAAVYRAHSDPELVARWLSPAGLEMDIAEWELRSGGRWRYIHRDAEGAGYGFNGVFHVARENEFIIQTFEFDGYPDTVSIESQRFEALDGGRCRLTVHAVYPSMEARDGIIASGMEHGLAQCYTRLDEVAAAI